MNNLEKTEKTFKINNVKFMAVSIHSRNFAKGIYNVIIYPMSYYNYKNLIRTTLVSKNPKYAIEIAKEYNINKVSGKSHTLFRGFPLGVGGCH